MSERKDIGSGQLIPRMMERYLFGSRLNDIVSPAHPVKSIEHLFGRDRELDRIEKALYAPGRHIFVYGDRGVGKSSLAATAANQIQSADAKYLDVSGGPDSTLKSIVARIASQAIREDRLFETKSSTATTLDFKYLKFEDKSEATPRDLLARLNTLDDAVEVLAEVSRLHSDRPVVVVDEFDRIQSAEERGKFADLIKQLGDKQVNIAFIFTGVAKSLDVLLGAHQSAIRQLETIELPKLSWDARWEIVRAAAREFQINVDHEILVRIAAVSDGYPYYVHLITEKLLWEVYQDEETVQQVSWSHYHSALKEAINSINAELRRPYESAVNQRMGDYEEVLWSTADSEYLDRYLKDMYSSYLYVMSKRRDRTALDMVKYRSRIRRLSGKACGEILLPDPSKPGLYTYREKMLRGYVRMQAEANGIELIGEQGGADGRPTANVPASAARGYRTSIVPTGVHFGRKRE